MNPDDLARILDELGERLGPTGEYVFALAVRQVYVNAVVYGVAALALVLVALWMWRVASSMTHSMADWDGPAVKIVAGLMLGVAFLLALSGVTRVLNPEYAALRDILGAIR